MKELFNVRRLLLACTTLIGALPSIACDGGGLPVEGEGRLQVARSGITEEAPVSFKATIRNASRSGVDECLIFGGNGFEIYPSRYLWGEGANAFCGFSTEEELEANKQAVFTLTPLGGDKYTISNASQSGVEECLIFGGNGFETYPARYLWGAGANAHCGFSTRQELLDNKQAVWTLRLVDNNKYIITNASRGGVEECLIFGGNGFETYPARYLWGAGANAHCGFSTRQELLDNKQAVWTITLLP